MHGYEPGRTAVVAPPIWARLRVGAQIQDPRVSGLRWERADFQER